MKHNRSHKNLQKLVGGIFLTTWCISADSFASDPNESIQVDPTSKYLKTTLCSQLTTEKEQETAFQDREKLIGTDSARTQIIQKIVGNTIVQPANKQFAQLNALASRILDKHQIKEKLFLSGERLQQCRFDFDVESAFQDQSKDSIRSLVLALFNFHLGLGSEEYSDQFLLYYSELVKDQVVDFRRNFLPTDDIEMMNQNILVTVDRLMSDDTFMDKISQRLSSLIKSYRQRMIAAARTFCDASDREIAANSWVMTHYISSENFKINRLEAETICHHNFGKTKTGQVLDTASIAGYSAALAAPVVLPRVSKSNPKQLIAALGGLSGAMIGGKFIHKAYQMETGLAARRLSGNEVKLNLIQTRLTQAAFVAGVPIASIYSMSTFASIIANNGGAAFFDPRKLAGDGWLIFFYNNAMSTIVGAQKFIENGRNPLTSPAYWVDQAGNFVAYMSMGQIMSTVFGRMDLGPLTEKFASASAGAVIFMATDDFIQSVKAKVDETYSRDPRISEFYVKFILTLNLGGNILQMNVLSGLQKAVSTPGAQALVKNLYSLGHSYIYQNWGYNIFIDLIKDPEVDFWQLPVKHFNLKTFNILNKDSRKALREYLRGGTRKPEQEKNQPDPGETERIYKVAPKEQEKS